MFSYIANTTLGVKCCMALTLGRFGIFPWIFAGAVSSGDVAHGFPGFCEKVVVFGPAFFEFLRSLGLEIAGGGNFIAQWVVGFSARNKTPLASP
ncbi:MAG: hypothetical protein ACKOF3_04525, partial [Spartobacteria bacterium]